MLERESNEISRLYTKEINLVMGVSYGRVGIIPCHRSCDHSCVSDSGNVLCDGYMGHTEVTVSVKGTKLYTVRCQNALESNY